MRLTLQIDLGNDGMQTAADVLAAINRSMNYPQLATMGAGDSEAIRDGNGNTVGAWEVVGDDEPKLKVRVSGIKKGDRFYNEYWGREVIATTDAYRLDGRDGAEVYRDGKGPTVAVMSQSTDGQWNHCWWMVEVGISDGKGSGGIWSEVEHRSIEVEREDTPV